MIPDLLSKISAAFDKLPGKGVRTITLALAGLVYGISGLVTGHLTPEQATQVILGSLGLIFAANH